MKAPINNNIAKSFEKLNDSLGMKDNKSGSSSAISDADQNKFKELISNKSDHNIQANLITEKPQESLTLGDKVLQGIHSIGTNIEDQSKVIKMNLTSDDIMNTKTMFQTQFAMSKLMITQDFTAKVVSKGTQAFDTLLKNQ
jgi:adenylosuccinate lyase